MLTELIRFPNEFKAQTISIDFDDTYTADTEFWDIFIRHAISRGHRIVCITYRYPDMDNDDIEDAFANVPVQVLYTSGTQKRPYAASQGVLVDIWIDDAPETI